MMGSDLTPDDMIKMPLAKFERRFGFRPVDALEKKHFAVTGNRPTAFIREVLETGIAGDSNLDDVVMD